MLKFLFIQQENENIGVEYISASLKQQGHQVELIFFPFSIGDKDENQQIHEKIGAYKPNIACFSPFSFQYPWSIAKAKYIKNTFPDIFTLFGGVHVNSVPECVMEDPEIDAIMVGEADKTIQEFSTNFEAGDISKTPSLWYRKNGAILKNPLARLETDLDSLPFPDKDLFYNSPLSPGLRHFPYTEVGSRGCPFACSYCSNNVYQRLYEGQKRFRSRSPENIVKELSENKAKYHFSRVEFADDVLAIDMPRLRKLMALYKQEINLPFACFFHPKLVSEETVRLMKEGGCVWFKLGVQSASEDYRKKFLNRYETNDNIRMVSKLCRQYHLQFSFDHILNLPGETKDHLIEAVNLYNECRPTIINFWGLMYLPATDIIKLGLEYRMITQQDIKAINNGSHKLSKLGFVPWYKDKKDSVNTSAFMLLFVLISLLPKNAIDFLIKVRFYDLPVNVPNFILVPLKVIVKFKAGQGYLYWSSVISYWMFLVYKVKRFFV
jgi:anaerobic magnesium-protoporphyrin IX monomethyl ester cyclase